MKLFIIMKYLKNTLIPLLAGVVLFSSIIEARESKNKAGRYFGVSSLPTDYEQFDVNQWTIDTSNDGRIAVNNVRGIGGEWRLSLIHISEPTRPY